MRLLQKLDFKHDFPFHPGKSRVFYGWIILVVGSLGVIMSLPGQTTGVSVFTDHLIANYKINRLPLTITYMIGTVFSGFLIRYVGKWYDEMGVRPIAIAAGITLALTLVLLSQLDRIVQSLSFLTGGKYSIPLLLFLLTPLFFLLRISGQGVTTLVSRNMVMKWFEARRGLANIFLGLIIAVGFNAAPRLFNELIVFSSWRKAWLIMAMVIAVVYIVIIVLFYRDNPQKSGLKPDGKIIKRKDGAKSNKTFRSNGEFTLREALRTREFWLYSGHIALLSLFVTGYTFNFESIFESQGLTKELALNIFLLAGAVSFVFQISGNLISDYVSLRYFLPGATFVATCSILSLPFIKEGNFFHYVFLISMGMNTAFFGIFSAITWPRFFGTKHLGEISGYSAGILVVASAIGPTLMALSFMFLGTYTPSFYLCAGISIILFVLSFTVRDERTLPR